MDVILGVEWLAKFGEVTLNWGEFSVKEGRRCCKRGSHIRQKVGGTRSSVNNEGCGGVDSGI